MKNVIDEPTSEDGSEDQNEDEKKLSEIYKEINKLEQSSSGVHSVPYYFSKGLYEYYLAFIIQKIVVYHLEIPYHIFNASFTSINSDKSLDTLQKLSIYIKIEYDMSLLDFLNKYLIGTDKSLLIRLRKYKYTYNDYEKLREYGYIFNDTESDIPELIKLISDIKRLFISIRYINLDEYLDIYLKIGDIKELNIIKTMLSRLLKIEQLLNFYEKEHHIHPKTPILLLLDTYKYLVKNIKDNTFILNCKKILFLCKIINCDPKISKIYTIAGDYYDIISSVSRNFVYFQQHVPEDINSLHLIKYLTDEIHNERERGREESQIDKLSNFDVDDKGILVKRVDITTPDRLLDIIYKNTQRSVEGASSEPPVQYSYLQKLFGIQFHLIVSYFAFNENYNIIAYKAAKSAADMSKSAADVAAFDGGTATYAAYVAASIAEVAAFVRAARAARDETARGAAEASMNSNDTEDDVVRARAAEAVVAARAALDEAARAAEAVVAADAASVANAASAADAARGAVTFARSAAETARHAARGHADSAADAARAAVAAADAAHGAARADATDAFAQAACHAAIIAVAAADAADAARGASRGAVDAARGAAAGPGGGGRAARGAAPAAMENGGGGTPKANRRKPLSPPLSPSTVVVTSPLHEE